MRNIHSIGYYRAVKMDKLELQVSNDKYQDTMMNQKKKKTSCRRIGEHNTFI